MTTDNNNITNNIKPDGGWIPCINWDQDCYGEALATPFSRLCSYHLEASAEDEDESTLRWIASLLGVDAGGDAARSVGGQR